MYSHFDCSSETHLNLSINNISDEIQAIFGDQTCNFEFHSIDGRLYQNNLVVLEADVLFNIIRKQWVQLEDVVLEDTYLRNINFNELQETIIETLKLCRYSVHGHSCHQQVKTLLNTVQRWTSLSDKFLAKLTSPSVRDVGQPISTYFHLYLNMQWLLLCLEHLNGVSTYYVNIIKDLIIFSYTLYTKIDVVKDNPFTCTCIKHLWLLLQYFCEQSQADFWSAFNDAIKTFDEVFVLWLLYNVSLLHGYNTQGVYIGSGSLRVKENFTLIEMALKSINSNCNHVSKDNNSMLLKCCSMIYPLVNDWWVQSAKSEPYQILWEIFNKHLNISLDVQPNVDTAGELMEVVSHISQTTKNSFEYFLFMLREHLTKYPNQWARIKGRIYSKLSTNKMRELTTVGLYNVGLLFLTLAHNVNIAEITEKLVSLLDVKQVRINPQVLHIHMCLVILHAQQGHSVETVSAPLVKLIQEDVVEHKEKYNLLRSYIDGLDSVLNASKNYYLKQHAMIGSWVSKYITCCSFSDLCYFLNVLLCNVKSLRKECAWSEWEQVLKQHVLPGLKSVATMPNCPSQVGTLAALIDLNPASDYVLIFTSDPITANVTCQFITTLLEDVMEGYYGLPKHHETAILHAWVRCCLLSCDSVDKLSKNVSKISALSELFDDDSISANPLCAFIKYLGKSSSKLINPRELCEQCFGRLDSWITPYLASPTSEASALHMYTCMSLLFYHCSSLLYHKNRSNCLFNRLVNFFLLSADTLMGKVPHAHVLSALQRTWHLFMHGIYTLDYSSDAYVERTLRDMVLRYIPLLSINNSPILKCFKNERLAVFILERISISFLTHSSRSLEVNTTKALKIIELVLENTSNMEVVVKCTLPGIFEVILFQSNKSLAIDLVRHIASCERNESVMQHIKCAFIATTEKHLAFHTQNYFQFASVLVKIMPVDMREFLPTVKKQVVEIERIRGVGYDNVLRQGLSRLEMLLTQF
ncbi:hypothetical protein RN001_015552 [Aquatica leii]|uniref:Protein MMS22-like n=1 Tax=Aquatica leii TaxID=1421715 RepID=A0AAN7SLA4_9COLE|nr:hypothetical protein RN001_015552 [Aquatica leii]